MSLREMLLQNSTHFVPYADLWYFFACEGLDLLANGGKLGYIVPNNWVSNAGASILRNKIITDSKIEALIDFSDFMVFTDASIQTMIMLLEKNHDTDGYTFLHQTLSGEPQAAAVSGALSGSLKNVFDEIQPKIKRAEWKDKFLKFSNDETENLLTKLANQANFFLDAKTEIAQGIVPNPDVLSTKSFNKYYTDKIGYSVGEPVFVLPKGYLSNLSTLEQSFLKPLYEPYELDRFYFPSDYQKEIIYLTKNNEKQEIKNLITHLNKFQEVTNERRETKEGKIKNYHLHWARDNVFFEKGEKIISVRKCIEPTFAYTDKECYVMMSCNVIKSARINLRYLTTIFNSKVVQFWLRHKGKMQGSNFQVDKEPLLQIPIVKTGDKKRHDELVNFADQMSKAQQTARAAVTDSDKSQTARRIAYLENQINRTVYQLYGLNADEIALIEQRTA